MAEYATRSTPRNAESNDSLTRESAIAPIQTEIVAIRRNGQIRRKMILIFPPIMACHTFVTIAGTNNRTIALGKSIAKVSMARLTIGRPRPITPLTVPAIMKVPTITKIVEVSINFLFSWYHDSCLVRHSRYYRLRNK